MNYLITDKSQFHLYQQAFRQLANAKMATVEDHILYNLLRGKDLKRGFTPITNPVKLNADYYKNEWRAFDQALSSLKSSIRHRAHNKQWYEKYGKPGETIVPTCMKYGETISEELWEAILKTLGESK